jgi:hypothetical protein
MERAPMDRSLIDQYEAGASKPAQAIAGLSREQLNAPPPPGAPGAWTIQQVIMHLMDSDLIGSDRMKRIIAEDNPEIIGYNESLFATRLFSHRLDAAMACETFRLNRLLTSTILRHLPDEAFHRRGRHNERGEMTLADTVRIYADHLDHHLRFIERKRMLMDRPG